MSYQYPDEWPGPCAYCGHMPMDHGSSQDAGSGYTEYFEDCRDCGDCASYQAPDCPHDRLSTLKRRKAVCDSCRMQFAFETEAERERAVTLSRVPSDCVIFLDAMELGGWDEARKAFARFVTEFPLPDDPLVRAKGLMQTAVMFCSAMPKDGKAHWED